MKEILLGVGSLIFTLAIFYIFKLKNDLTNLSMLRFNMNLEKDLEPLLYLIDFKCDNYEKTILSTRGPHNKGLMNDIEFNEIIEELILDITSSLNPHYLRMLNHKYYTDEGLDIFIAQKVISRMSILFNNLNLNTLLKMSE